MYLISLLSVIAAISPVHCRQLVEDREKLVWLPSHPLHASTCPALCPFWPGVGTEMVLFPRSWHFDSHVLSRGAKCNNLWWTDSGLWLCLTGSAHEEAVVEVKKALAVMRIYVGVSERERGKAGVGWVGWWCRDLIQATIYNHINVSRGKDW